METYTCPNCRAVVQGNFATNEEAKAAHDSVCGANPKVKIAEMRENLRKEIRRNEKR